METPPSPARVTNGGRQKLGAEAPSPRHFLSQCTLSATPASPHPKHFRGYHLLEAGHPGGQETGVQVKAFRLTMRRAKKSDDENAPCTSHFPSRTWAEEEEEGCLREGTAHLDEDVIITMLGDLEQVLYTDILGKLTLA